MIRISLPRDRVEESWHLAAAIEATGLYATPNYTGLSEDNRFFTGYLGEFAVAKWLTDLDIRHKHRVKASGHSEPAEFLVWHKGQAYRLEVKTAGKPCYEKFMMPESQPIDALFYLGARVSTIVPECCISLHGWLGARQVSELPVEMVKVLTRWCYLNELWPFEKLVPNLDRVSAV